MNWFDIIVWCNAYSEYANANLDTATYGSFEPVYKTGAGVVLKNSTLDILATLLGTAGSAPDPSKISVPAHDAPGFRLPSDAEWEFAARGANPSSPAWSYTYAGGNAPYERAWYQDNSDLMPHASGGLLPNTLGLYDMSGNAREIIGDIASGGTSIFRGGSVEKTADLCALSYWFPVGNVMSARLRIEEGFRVAGPWSIGAAPPASP
jgi:hypothetical protein